MESGRRWMVSILEFDLPCAVIYVDSFQRLDKMRENMSMMSPLNVKNRYD